MKLLKKLLPVATIASSIACVAPIMTACGSGVGTSTESVKDYKSKITPLPVGTTVTSEQVGVEQYLSKSNIKEIIADDYKSMISTVLKDEHVTPYLTYLSSYTIEAGFDVSNITTKETTNGTKYYLISCKISAKVSLEGELPAGVITSEQPSIAAKASASINYTMSNLILSGGYENTELFSNWVFGVGASKEALSYEESAKFEGNLSWDVDYVKVDGQSISEFEEYKYIKKYLSHSTGTRSISYATYPETWNPSSQEDYPELDEKFDRYVIAMGGYMGTWVSSYYKNVTIEA